MDQLHPPPEEASSRLDERLQTLIDAVGDALIAATLDGRVVACNESACRLFGYSPAELCTLSRAELVFEDERTRAIRAERRSSGTARGVVTLVRKGGEHFEGETTTIEVTAADGERRVWTAVHDLADRKRAEQARAALSESNELLRALTDAAFEAIVIHRDGRVLVANRAAEQIAQAPPGGLEGRPIVDFIAPEALPMVLERIRSGNEEPYESLGIRADGSVYPQEIQVRVGPVNVKGAPARVAAIRDVSERKRLEEEVRHAQKMEAVGRLAGGVAHDFNNLLSVIVGAAGLAASEIEPSHPAQAALDDVRRAAGRAAELTQKLLAFGRKQVVKARPLDVNRALSGMESMLRSFVGGKVKLSVDLEPGLGPVIADRSQLELMLLNLVANARDAMPEGGRLVVATQRGFVEESEARRLGTLPGPHSLISVTDDGHGMDEATKEHVFEPFFTTKGPGRGTGLGLSTVFGIVKQSQGTVSVESQPGRGAKFVVSLPQTTEPLPSDGGGSSDRLQAVTTRRILVVEDEPDVRRVVVHLLRRAGHEVVDVDGPHAALTALRARTERFDLLLTDVLMPGMSGRQLADAVRSELPSVAVLYMSGFPDSAFDAEKAPAEGDDLLPKPFTPQTLLAAVTKALASR